MHALRSPITVVGLAAACAVSVIPGQILAQPFSSEVQVPRVEVPVRVVDSAAGEPIRGLTADAFQLFEDGVELELGDPERSLHLGAAKMRRVQVPLQLRIPLAGLRLLDRGPVTWGQLTIYILATDADGHQC
jgi:hypothetical protein